jgi:hypothetical protein
MLVNVLVISPHETPDMLSKGVSKVLLGLTCKITDGININR